jgi:hypothetical protein
MIRAKANHDDVRSFQIEMKTIREAVSRAVEIGSGRHPMAIYTMNKIVRIGNLAQRMAAECDEWINGDGAAL